MPILIFSPVQIIITHPLERRNDNKTTCLLSEVREMAKSFILMQSISK